MKVNNVMSKQEGLRVRTGVSAGPRPNRMLQMLGLGWEFVSGGRCSTERETTRATGGVRG